MKTIHDRPRKTTPPRVTFDWSPKANAFSITLGGDTLPWSVNTPSVGAPDQPDVLYTHLGEELTFTANVEVDEGDFILEYQWDFGDGVIGYGPSVVHTYRANSPQIRVHLTVTDNHHRKVYVGQQVILLAPDGFMSVGIPQPIEPDA
jgi:hypothetical protein